MIKMVARPSLVLLALLLIACGAGTGSSPTPGASATAGPTGAPSPTPTSVPNANVAVVRIEQTGGMLPPWETMRWYPSVVLYGDGRLILQGPQIEIYPGPALPNLQVTHVSQRGVEQVLQWAAEAGLQGEDRQLGDPILDSGVTLFTVVSATGTHHTSVTTMASARPEIGALVAFQTLMLDLRSWLPNDIAGAETPYAWDRLRIISFPGDPNNQPDPNLVSIVDWPLGGISTIGKSFGEPVTYRCGLIEGDDLATLRPLLEQANELTLWRSDDVTYQLYLHPLLPDDEACPGF